MNVIAPRWKSAMDNLTRNLSQKLMTIKAAASLLKRNWPAFVEIKVAGKSFPRKQIVLPEKSKINPIFHLPKSAKKLDVEEPRTVLHNGNELSHPIACQTLAKSSYIPILISSSGSKAWVWMMLQSLMMA